MNCEDITFAIQSWYGILYFISSTDQEIYSSFGKILKYEGISYGSNGIKIILFLTEYNIKNWIKCINLNILIFFGKIHNTFLQKYKWKINK